MAQQGSQHSTSSSEAIFSLQHFYYGPVVRDTKADDKQRLLGASAGVSQEQIVAALKETRIPASRDPEFMSWAIVQGSKSPFIFVQAALVNGVVQRHIILLPSEILRAYGGNLRDLSKLLEPNMRTFSTVANSLDPIIVRNVTLPTESQQETALLSLLSATRDRYNMIESLLTGIIHGMKIVISDAPMVIRERQQFIEGLLTLLPPPARFGVTFATLGIHPPPVEAQISFYSVDAPQPNTLVYKWQETTLAFGEVAKNDYSRYICSQLRLDINLVIQQANALTPVAGWRIRHGDNLLEALKYASYRLKVDNALINHQPIETDDVANILMEDPTLTDELRTQYIEHLLAFSLALDDVEAADLLPRITSGQPKLERSILNALLTAVDSGKASRVYSQLATWLRMPNGLQGMFWIDVLHRSAIIHAENLAKAQDADSLNAFLQDLAEAPLSFSTGVILPQLLDVALPLVSKNKQLTENLMLIAASTLSMERWQKLLSLASFVEQLPVPVREFLNFIQNPQRPVATPNLVQNAVQVFPDIWQPLLEIRFAELILSAGRIDLFDTITLDHLAQSATSDIGTNYDSCYRWLVRTLATDSVLATYDIKGRKSILQILLARGLYGELANELSRHARLFYPPDQQQFSDTVYEIFKQTPILQDQIGGALYTLSVRDVKPLPLAMAYFGVLEQHTWANELASTAIDLVTLLAENRSAAENVPPKSLYLLLQFFANRREPQFVSLVASLLSASAARQGEAGYTAMLNLAKISNPNAEVQTAITEALRQYIRRVDQARGQALIKRPELNTSLREALEITLLINNILNGQAFTDYADALNITAHFLFDTGMAFANPLSQPSVGTLLNDLDSLLGGLSRQESNTLALSMLETIRLIGALAIQHRTVYSRESEDHIRAILNGQTDVRTMLDLFRVIGGYFSRGRWVSARADRKIPEHALADRALNNLFPEVQAMNQLLRHALDAFPKGEKVSLKPALITAEIESIWSGVVLHERRRLVHDLAIDFQHVSELILTITEKVDIRSLLSDSSTARKLDQAKKYPDNGLEYYRFMHGYFKNRA